MKWKTGNSAVMSHCHNQPEFSLEITIHFGQNLHVSVSRTEPSIFWEQSGSAAAVAELTCLFNIRVTVVIIPASHSWVTGFDSLPGSTIQCHLMIFVGMLSESLSPFHHGMARPQVTNGGDGLQIWKAAANTLNKQQQTADEECSPRFGLELLTVKSSMLWNVTQ
jgi:hypothetical protein